MPTLTLDKLNDVVKEFDLNSDNYSTFVETGTYVGDTVRSVQPYFEQVHTIEISKSLYDRFFKEHPKYENVNCLSLRAKILIEMRNYLAAIEDLTYILDYFTEDLKVYDGSAWTAGGNLNTARKNLGGAGIQTSALGFGGNTTAVTAATEEYSGAVLAVRKITT